MVHFILTGRSAGVKHLWQIQYRAFRPTNPTETLGLGTATYEDLVEATAAMILRVMQSVDHVDLSLTPDQAAEVAVLMIVRRRPSPTASDGEPSTTA